MRCSFHLHSDQRINVALTRAKRILRIVGKLEFWENQPSGSILRKLVEHCKVNEAVCIKGKKCMKAFITPNWSEYEKGSTWEATMSSEFHHSVKTLTRIQRNITVNTLIKLALPSLDDLAHPPRREKKKPLWQVTSYKNHETLGLVWCALSGDMKPSILARFAGSRDDCLKYIQTHPNLPKGAACVKRDLSGVEVDSTLGESQSVELSWPLTKNVGNAMLEKTLVELPKGCFKLDEKQDMILHRELPLMLESGSGTGKVIRLPFVTSCVSCAIVLLLCGLSTM